MSGRRENTNHDAAEVMNLFLTDGAGGPTIAVNLTFGDKTTVNIVNIVNVADQMGYINQLRLGKPPATSAVVLRDQSRDGRSNSKCLSDYRVGS